MGGTGQSSGKRVRSRCVRESSFDVGTGHDRSRVAVYPNRFRRVNRAPEKFFPEAQLLPKPEFSSVLPARNADETEGGCRFSFRVEWPSSLRFEVNRR